MSDRSCAFGSFVIDEASRSLFNDGRRVELPPRYFDLLLFLIEQRARVVTKDDLYERIWNDEIVTEGAIAQGVRFLRRTLGDNARDPRFIRTISKFGYQWIAALNSHSVSEAAPAMPAQPSSVVEPGRSKGGPHYDGDRAGEIRIAFRIALGRYAFASLGSALSGALAGGLGALPLIAASSPRNPGRTIMVLALLGIIIGGLGGVGVGFGLSFAESLVRRSRPLVLAIAGGISGAIIGGLSHSIFAAIVMALFGRSLPAFGGAHEGVWVGAFTGLGYGLSTRDRALAAPRGRERAKVVALAGLLAGLGAAIASALGASFSAASVDAIASVFRGSELSLSSLGTWIGEPDFGRLSRVALSAYEGLFFGAGLVYGLTRRPNQSTHATSEPAASALV
jgi:DNA-binding winged helix-turn-helix (wHTH) protein